MDQQPKTLWIKRQFLEEILEGRKTIEVRVGYQNIQELKPGMRLLLNEEHDVGIKDVRKYPSFQALLDNEDPNLIVPGKPKPVILNILRKFYPPYKEKLGVFAIELELSGPEPQS